MPSPIAHTAAAYALYRVARRSTPPRPEEPFRAWLLAELGLFGGLIFLSLLPDLDVIPGILTGDLAGFHNNVSHSFAFAVVIAPLVGVVVRLVWRSGFWRFTGIAFFAYSLHVVMDYFTVGRGVMLWWPVSAERLAPPMPLFQGVRWAEGWWTFNHGWTLLNELGWVALLLLFLHFRPPERR